jgi:hypothetical protein
MEFIFADRVEDVLREMLPGSENSARRKQA